ncbi:tyrosine-type recombinase/integrase [Tsukamurella strandjordii]|uniref:Tyrosine-type recombinase/integrase n=1 Tax=Tsukamurella strandjordii TaxID=147577 RepID=A0AA90NGJ8_9ACTN|nr:site-specific integrase [Tsukamurella strandjordii]MDP0398698.1 tyrosine-type recombinase/integrase [Tsukamurella strandjordii]
MGSISKTVRNGNVRYVARVSRGGKQYSKTFHTAKEADDWNKEQEGRRTNLTRERRDREPVRKAVQRHLDAADTDGSRTTRKHLLENLGDLEWLPLDEVTPEDVGEWLEGLRDGREWADGKPLARTTANMLMSILSAVFNDAVALGYLARNPAKGVKRIATDIAVLPHQVITSAEVRAITELADEPFATMVRLAAATGLRPGEVAGLRVRSVDLDRRMLRVTEQASGLHGEWGWKPPKTRRAYRSLPLAYTTLNMLAAHLESRDGKPQEPLFLAEHGGQWSVPNIGRKWRAVADEAGVEGHSFKSLRHFYASALIEAGRSPVAVSELMGHASATITLEVYSHLWPGEHEATRAAVDALDI